MERVQHARGSENSDKPPRVPVRQRRFTAPGGTWYRQRTLEPALPSWQRLALRSAQGLLHAGVEAERDAQRGFHLLLDGCSDLGQRLEASERWGVDTASVTVACFRVSNLWRSLAASTSTTMPLALVFEGVLLFDKLLH